MSNLRKTLSLPAAVGLAITMVVGSGLLVVPGIAYKEAGNTSIYAWIVCCLAIIPILVVFGQLGAQFPGAGGIALFVQNAFNRRAGGATEILILGTVPGGSALLLVAGGYGAAATSTGQIGLIVATAITAVVAFAIISGGGKVSGRINQVIAIVLIIVLGAICILALKYGKAIANSNTTLLNFGGILRTSSLVFFAFVGWELLSFTTEEYKNPTRDFPLSIAVSYIIVVLLYMLISYSIQHMLVPEGEYVSTAPFVALIRTTGIGFGHIVVAILGYLISLSNVIGILWAFSRLLFSSARQGLMPLAMSKLSAKAKVPINAVVLALGLFLIPAVLNLVGLLELDLLFRLAGSCFLFAYILASISFYKIGKGRLSKAVSVLSILVSLFILCGFGFLVIYPIVLFSIAYLLVGIRTKKAKRKEST